MLLAVDEGLGQIIQELERQDILDDTAILFTSDNGFFYGEHDLSVERRMPYEEGVRVPLLFRYPKLAKKGQVIDNFILSIDIAPTMLDLAGVEIGKHIQGESFVRLLAKKRENAPTVPWRNSFLMEYVSYEKPMPWLVNTTYKVVRMEQYKYIHWVNYKDKDELYDLNSDPYELNNRIADEKLTSVVIQLKQELSRLVSAAYGLE